MDPVNDGLRGRLSLDQRRSHLHPTKVQIATHRALRDLETLFEADAQDPEGSDEPRRDGRIDDHEGDGGR